MYVLIHAFIGSYEDFVQLPEQDVIRPPPPPPAGINYCTCQSVCSI